jgi:hypothetical protein
MFKLVAFLFLATNLNEPIGHLTYNDPPFASEELCKAFIKSEDGKAAIGFIERVANARSTLAKFECVKVPDDSI